MSRHRTERVVARLNGRAARVTAFGLWVTGLSALARRLLTANGRFVIELHGVPTRPYRELPPPIRPSLAAADLERLLWWLSRRFRFLTPDEFLESSAPGVLLTFDDGFANNHDVVLPLLRQYGAPAVFFVATQHIGRDGIRLGFVEAAGISAWGQVSSAPRTISRDLLDGMEERDLSACAASGLVTIGAHTVSHPRLTTLDDGQLEAEIYGSKAMLENLIGTTVDLFAYPFGDADRRVAQVVAAAGFRAAFVEDRLPIEPAHLAVPRVGIHASSPWYLAAKLSGLQGPPLTGRVLAL